MVFVLVVLDLVLVVLVLMKLVLIVLVLVVSVLVVLVLADLQKAGSKGSAEPNFFQLFRQICLVFGQIMSFPCSNYKRHGIFFL